MTGTVPDQELEAPDGDPFHPAPGQQWRPVAATANGCLTLTEPLSGSATGAVLVWRRVYSAGNLAAAVRVNGTGPLELWADGQLVCRCAPVRFDSVPREVPLALHAGWNTLLFRVGLKGRPCLLCVPLLPRFP
jgi:hypothetical protein